MTYADYLKQNGASAEDIAVLDTPVARKAYDTMAAQAAESERLRAIAETDRQNYQQWYETQALPAYTDMQTKVVSSTAELARAKAAVLAAQEQGLTEVAKTLGWTADGAPPARVDPATPPNFDASKYVSTDTLREISEQMGASLAGLQDMVLEHSALFPNQRLNVSELRREAVAAKKNIQQFWLEKYNVQGARDAQAAAAKASYETKLREEGAASERAKIADMANPNLRTLESSNSPFTQRTDRDRVKQPWEVGDRTGDRVASATRKLLEQSAAKVN